MISATYWFRGLKRPLPLPCANRTMPRAFGGTLRIPSSSTSPAGISTPYTLWPTDDTRCRRCSPKGSMKLSQRPPISRGTSCAGVGGSPGLLAEVLLDLILGGNFGDVDVFTRIHPDAVGRVGELVRAGSLRAPF